MVYLVAQLIPRYSQTRRRNAGPPGVADKSFPAALLRKSLSKLQRFADCVMRFPSVC